MTGWEVVADIVAPQLEADVDVWIAPKVRPHAVERETDGIRIRGTRGGTAKAIHPVRRFRSDTDRQVASWFSQLDMIDMMSRKTRSLSDMPLGSVCACRAQREHRSNCRD